MYPLLLFESATAATRAKRALLTVGISATQRKITGKGGCRYTLLLDARDLYTATAELRRQQIAFEIQSHGE